MSRRYKTGTAAEVLRRMAAFAIRDQQALIDAYTPNEWEELSAEAASSIEDCRQNIADFRRMACATKRPTTPNPSQGTTPKEQS